MAPELWSSAEAGLLALLAALGVIGFVGAALVGTLQVVRRRHRDCSKRVERCLETARALLASPERTDLARAIGLLDSALEQAPPWWAPLLVELKARALMQLRDYGAVLHLLQDFLPRKEGWAGIREAYGGTCLYTGEEAQREAFWKSVLLGQACFHVARLEDSLALLQRAKWHARIIATSSPDATSSLLFSRKGGPMGGTELGTGGAPLEAVTRLIGVVKYLVRRRAAGEAASAAGLHSEAVRQFTRVLDSRKGTPPALAAALYRQRAGANATLLHLPQAIADYNRAAALEEDDGEVLWQRALLYGQLGEHAECVKDLESLLEGKEGTPGLALGLDSGRRKLKRSIQPWHLRHWGACMALLRGMQKDRCAFAGLLLAFWRSPKWDWAKKYVSRCSIGLWRGSPGMGSQGGPSWARRNVDRVTAKLAEARLLEARDICVGRSDFSRYLTLEHRLESAAEIEAAYRIALLRHTLDKGASFLEKCSIRNVEAASAAAAKVAAQDLRLLEVMRKARDRAISALKTSANVTVETSGNIVLDREPMNQQQEAGTEMRERHAETLPSSTGWGLAEEEQQDDSETWQTWDERHPYADKIFTGASSSSKRGPPGEVEIEGDEVLARAQSVGMRGEGRQGAKKGSFGKERGGRSEWMEDDGPLKAGECDSLLRGLGDVDVLADSVDLSVLSVLDSLDGLGGRQQRWTARKPKSDGAPPPVRGSSTEGLGKSKKDSSRREQLEHTDVDRRNVPKAAQAFDDRHKHRKNSEARGGKGGLKARTRSIDKVLRQFKSDGSLWGRDGQGEGRKERALSAGSASLPKRQDSVSTLIMDGGGGVHAMSEQDRERVQVWRKVRKGVGALAAATKLNKRSPIQGTSSDPGVLEVPSEALQLLSEAATAKSQLPPGNSFNLRRRSAGGGSPEAISRDRQMLLVAELEAEAPGDSPKEIAQLTMQAARAVALQHSKENLVPPSPHVGPDSKYDEHSRQRALNKQAAAGISRQEGVAY